MKTQAKMVIITAPSAIIRYTWRGTAPSPESMPVIAKPLTRMATMEIHTQRKKRLKVAAHSGSLCSGASNSAAAGRKAM